MTSFVTIEAGVTSTLGAIPTNVSLFLASETFVGAPLGTFTREMALFATFVAFAVTTYQEECKIKC